MNIRDELPSEIYDDLEFLLRDFGFVMQENGHSDQVSSDIRIVWQKYPSSIFDFSFYHSLTLVSSYRISKIGNDGTYLYYLETPEEKKSSFTKEFWFKHLTRYLTNEYLKQKGVGV